MTSRAGANDTELEQMKYDRGGGGGGDEVVGWVRRRLWNAEEVKKNRDKKEEGWVGERGSAGD